MIFTAGIVGCTAARAIETDDFVAQARQAFRNIAAILAQGGAKPEHIVRLTWYIRDRAEYLAAAKALGAAYREAFGAHYPAMAVVEVSALMDERAKLEIEATAVVPD
jgi:enamine deaminase RidA (YjgF/YER057c/UK114 family)